MNFYELQAPTEWAAPPTTWSSTTFDDVEACPRRWQLLRSRWGKHERFPTRPSPAAIEGQIIHDALDRLTRACGQRGNPAFGSAEFAAAAADADFFPGFARAVDEWQQKLGAHPRPGPAFRLRATAEELTNHAVRMFREQYKPDGHAASRVAEKATEGMADVGALLRHRRALSEVKLRHPTLPFLGIIDRVQLASDGVEVVDFKTGRPSEKHHQQLLRYALLWWRATEEVPVRVSAQYLHGVESWPVANRTLAEIEADLTRRVPSLGQMLLARPAIARAGAGCHACPVRARCATGWSVGEEMALVEGRGDAELVVTATAGEHGFLARSRSGAEVAVVYEPTVAKMLSEPGEGQVLRILDGVWKEKRSQFEIKAWTEVFVVSPEDRQ
jgi:hypothetical protein